jgi:hypothetical protein
MAQQPKFGSNSRNSPLERSKCEEEKGPGLYSNSEPSSGSEQDINPDPLSSIAGGSTLYKKKRKKKKSNSTDDGDTGCLKYFYKTDKLIII